LHIIKNGDFRVELCYSDDLNYGVEVSKEIRYKLVLSQGLVPIQILMPVCKTIKTNKEMPVTHFHNLELMEESQFRIDGRNKTNVIDSL